MIKSGFAASVPNSACCSRQAAGTSAALAAEQGDGIEAAARTARLAFLREIAERRGRVSSPRPTRPTTRSRRCCFASSAARAWQVSPGSVAHVLWVRASRSSGRCSRSTARRPVITLPHSDRNGDKTLRMPNRDSRAIESGMNCCRSCGETSAAASTMPYVAWPIRRRPRDHGSTQPQRVRMLLRRNHRLPLHDRRLSVGMSSRPAEPRKNPGVRHRRLARTQRSCRRRFFRADHALRPRDACFCIASRSCSAWHRASISIIRDSFARPRATRSACAASSAAAAPPPWMSRDRPFARGHTASSAANTTCATHSIFDRREYRSIWTRSGSPAVVDDERKVIGREDLGRHRCVALQRGQRARGGLEVLGRTQEIIELSAPPSDVHRVPGTLAAAGQRETCIECSFDR